MSEATSPTITGFSDAQSGPTGWAWAIMSSVDGFRAYFEACASWQQEMARFIELRVMGNRRTLRALMSSRDIAGAMKAQQDWGLQAATDYTTEATRLARLLTSLSLTGTTPAAQDAASLIA
jgi:hypothetical protein